ncbi:MAG: LUD domain-containing protein [Eubacterium sp.]|jgi:hypothetical protein|nr:LUD domain-containing protein [Eubacterium sp.]
MTPIQIDYEHKAQTIIKQLEKRRMEGYYFAGSAEAVKFANSLVKDGASVSFGGSATLNETGMTDSLRARKTLTIYDRSAAASKEEISAVYHNALSCDTYFMSTNAITLDGQLVNVDGTGNRVAALIYGPKQVVILAGMNKVVRTTEDGISRVHNIASPPNCIRLGRNTPCAATGMCADCLGEDCICSQTVITRRSGERGRIKVILIGEELGF